MVSSMSEVDLIAGTGPYNYTIAYSLFVDGLAISTITISKSEDNITASSIPVDEGFSLTWVNAPGLGDTIMRSESQSQVQISQL